MVNIGNDKHNHGEGVQSSLICAVKFPPAKHFLQDYDNGMETTNFTQPFVYGIGRN